MATENRETVSQNVVAITEIALGDRVVDVDGVYGVVQAHEQGEAVPAQILVRLNNGDQYSLPLWLLKQTDGVLTVPVSYQDLKERYRTATGEGEMILPVTEEQLKIEKTKKVTGRVRFHKQVHKREVEVDEPVRWDEVNVQRTPINRYVKEPVRQRQEGDTLVIPVLEEVLVVSKRLKLVEEIRITKREHVGRAHQRFTLRSEEIVVERMDGHQEIKE